MNVYLSLCVAVCLAVWFLSVLVGALAGEGLLGWLRRNQAGGLQLSSAALFALRMAPFILGSVTTIAFVLPSFLLLEPKRTTESPEAHLLVLAGLALAILGTIMVRWLRLTRETRSRLRLWVQSGRRVRLPRSALPVYAIAAPGSLVAVIGVLRPRVFIGREALASLTIEELEAAVAHELAHVRACDNLRQLLLRITRLPGGFANFGWAETAWSEAAEFGADRGALLEGASPLDLASALVKVSRLKSSDQTPGLAACHLIAARDGSAVALRVRNFQKALSTSS